MDDKKIGCEKKNDWLFVGHVILLPGFGSETDVGGVLSLDPGFYC